MLYPSLPIVLYTKVTPAIGPALLRLGRAGISHLIVAWTEDQPSAFRNTLLDAASKAVSRQLIRDLQVCFQDWPAGLKLALEHAILNPTSVMTVSELAKRAGTDRRSCLRWFNKAQFTTAKYGAHRPPRIVRSPAPRGSRVYSETGGKENRDQSKLPRNEYQNDIWCQSHGTPAGHDATRNPGHRPRAIPLAARRTRATRLVGVTAS